MIGGGGELHIKYLANIATCDVSVIFRDLDTRGKTPSITISHAYTRKSSAPISQDENSRQAKLEVQWTVYFRVSDERGGGLILGADGLEVWVERGKV